MNYGDISKPLSGVDMYDREKLVLNPGNAILISNGIIKKISEEDELIEEFAPDYSNGKSDILNLVNASQADNKDVLWGFIRGYIGEISEDAEIYIGQLLDYALSYFNDFILPTKVYREASDEETKSLKELVLRFSQLDKGSEAVSYTHLTLPTNREV